MTSLGVIFFVALNQLTFDYVKFAYQAYIFIFLVKNAFYRMILLLLY